MNQSNLSPAPGQRYRILGVAVAIFMLMGAYYGWSIFVPPLENEFGWQRAQTSLPFTVCLIMFCLGGVGAGFLNKFWKQRYTIWLGALMIGTGFSLGSRAESLAALCIGYGALGGGGIGAAYNAILSMTLRWFPDRLGLASGLLMMAYGLGGLTVNVAGTQMIAAWGWRATMFAFALAISLIMALGAFFIAAPPDGLELPRRPDAGKTVNEDSLDLAPGQMLRRSSFRLYFAWILLLYASGLMLIGHAVPFAGELSFSPGLAALLAGLVAACNGGGRLLSGLMLDRFGRKALMRGISCCFIAAALLLLLALQSGGPKPLSVAGFILAGLAYGGAVACTAAVISLFYGARNYSLNFSLANCATAFAALLGPFLAGWLHRITGGYSGLALSMLLFGGLALLLAVRLKRP